MPANFSKKCLKLYNAPSLEFALFHGRTRTDEQEGVSSHFSYQRSRRSCSLVCTKFNILPSKLYVNEVYGYNIFRNLKTLNCYTPRNTNIFRATRFNTTCLNKGIFWSLLINNMQGFGFDAPNRSMFRHVFTLYNALQNLPLLYEWK